MNISTIVFKFREKFRHPSSLSISLQFLALIERKKKASPRRIINAQYREWFRPLFCFHQKIHHCRIKFLKSKVGRKLVFSQVRELGHKDTCSDGYQIDRTDKSQLRNHTNCYRCHNKLYLGQKYHCFSNGIILLLKRNNIVT